MGQPLTLVSGAQTTSTVSSGYIVDDTSAGCVSLVIESSSGTNPTLHAWLQGSNDGGVNWADVPAIQVIETASTSTDQVANLSKRNVCTAATTASAHYAAYYTVPSQVRLKWEIGGTSTPTFTFVASFRG